jgi:hypothetical protein
MPIEERTTNRLLLLLNVAWWSWVGDGVRSSYVRIVAYYW